MSQTPITLVEQQLDGITKLLQEIKQLLEKPATVKPKAKQKTAKVCTHCGQVHERGVDYAICAKRHKK